MTQTDSDIPQTLQLVIDQFKPAFEKQEFNRFKAAALTGLLSREIGTLPNFQTLAGQAHAIAVHCMADRRDSVLTDRGIPA